MKHLILLLIAALLLAGCWNYREIDNLAIALGLAVDKGEGDSYIVTVEIINLEGAGPESEFKPTTVQAQSDTIFGAIRRLITVTGKKLYWAHAKVVIISEEIAREGILPILDFVQRDAEIRSDVWLLVSKEETAAEILASTPLVESSISQQLSQILQHHAPEPKSIPEELWNFMQKLTAPGIAPVIATVGLVEQGEEKLTRIKGVAFFRRDKMVGWLDGKESLALSYLLNESISGLIVLRYEESGLTAQITYEVVGNKTEFQPFIKDDQITMGIVTNLQVILAEVANQKVDFSQPSVRSKLESDLAEHLEELMKRTIIKLQQYNSDAVGLGSVLRRRDPEAWKLVADDWPAVFGSLQTDIRVKPVIRASALVSKPIEMRD